LLIETHGADVSIRDIYEDTPIYVALRHFDPNYGGDITVLTYLINQKAVNVNIQDRVGHNLLHYACINNIAGKLGDLNTQSDTALCKIIEVIVERCVGSILDETTTS
jgi:hypothetical protein